MTFNFSILMIAASGEKYPIICQDFFLKTVKLPIAPDVVIKTREQTTSKRVCVTL